VAGDTNSVIDIFVHDLLSGVTTRVSVATDGTEENMCCSGHAVISANGRYVAFGSSSTNLVNTDTNGQMDVFLHDTQSGETTRVSVASNGTEANNKSGDDGIAISADGRFVEFSSWATNLVSGDTNGNEDIFLHDTQSGATTRVSVSTAGLEGNKHSTNPSISADGRYVAFESFSSNFVIGDQYQSPDVFIHDTQTGITRRISGGMNGTEANGGFPNISADGRYVTFNTQASNIVSSDTNGKLDGFLHELEAFVAMKYVYLPIIVRNAP
jgi:Tol biopolymer transport system component